MTTLKTEFQVPSLEETTVLSASDKAFLREVAAKIRAVEPGAELLLYGSRGRGDAREDSDWDILAIVDRDPTRPFRRRLRSSILSYCADERTFVELAITSATHFLENRDSMEIYHNVLEDAVRL